MDIDSDFVATGFIDPVVGVSLLGTMRERIINDIDPYGGKDALKDMGSGFLKLMTATSVVSGVALLAASGGGIPGMASIVKVAKVGAAVTGGVSLGAGAFNWGQSILEKPLSQRKK